MGHVASGERAIIVRINARSHSIPAVLLLPSNHFQNHTLISAPTGTQGTSDSSGWSKGNNFFLISAPFHLSCETNER
jgi:hypothetical protein